MKKIMERYKRFPLFFANKPDGVLYAPNELTRAEFALLRQQIDNALDVIEATSLVNVEQVEINGNLFCNDCTGVPSPSIISQTVTEAAERSISYVVEGE